MHDTAITTSDITARTTAGDLVPLTIDFDTVLRGYDREQVRCYVDATERDTQLLVADRDAALSQAEDLSAQLASARATIRQLQHTIDRIGRTPIDPDALSQRLRRMVELATAEAAETTRRAHAAADRTWRHAEDTAARLTERHRELLTELDQRRRDMEAEHTELIRRAQADIDRMTHEAHQRRDALDQRAEQLRAQAQTDFDLAMSARRAELQAELTQRRAEADAEFHRHIGALRDEVDRLCRLRDAVREQLITAQDLLAGLLTDLDTEEPPPQPAACLPSPRADPAVQRPSRPVQDAGTGAALAGCAP